jgi:hypothetical protein
MFQRTVGLLLIIGACGATTLPGCATGSAGVRVAGEATNDSKAAFERLKALQGNWYGKDEQGKEVLSSVYKVSSNGSAVVETMFPGQAHEMTNVYTIDGSRLLATHYCAAGNQPRMECPAMGPDGSIPFTFESVSNLASREQSYMGGVTLRTPEKNKLVQEWTNYIDGKVNKDHQARFELTRK